MNLKSSHTLQKWYLFSRYHSSRMGFTVLYPVKFISQTSYELVLYFPTFLRQFVWLKWYSKGNSIFTDVLIILLTFQEYWLDAVSRRSALVLISVHSTWPAFPWPFCLHLFSILTEWYGTKVLPNFPHEFYLTSLEPINKTTWTNTSK